MTDTARSHDVQHNEARRRFEITVEGHLNKVEYELEGQVMRILHTVVHPSVEGRGIDHGDTALVDLERWETDDPVEHGSQAPTPSPDPAAPRRDGELHKGVSVELGSTANPPGFDEQLLGLEAGSTKSFTIRFPPDYPAAELAGNRDKAADYYQKLLALAKDADTPRPELASAKQYVAK